MVPGRVSSLLVDFIILALCYLTLILGCEDWCVCTDNIEVVISRNTETLLAAYVEEDGKKHLGKCSTRS